MSFSFSGTTITQSSTDDTASFLSGVSGNGATVTSYGNTSHSIFHIVDFGSNSLYVDGDLDVDMKRIIIVFSGTDTTERLYARHGSIKLRSPQVTNGYSYNPESGSVIFALDNPNNWSLRSLRVNTAGNRSEFIGITLKGEFSAALYGNVSMKNCVVEKMGNVGNIQFNVEGDTELIDLKKYDDGQTGITFRSNSTNVIVSNVQIVGARDGFNNESGSVVTIAGMPIDVGNNVDISQWAGKKTKVLDCEGGTQFKWGGHLLNSGVNKGYVEAYKSVSASLLDGDGVGIGGAKFYMEDSVLVATNSIMIDGVSASTKRIYSFTSDSNGDVAGFEVLTGEGERTSGGTQFSYTLTDNWVRPRGANVLSTTTPANNITDDVYNWSSVAYNNNITSGFLALKGKAQSVITSLAGVDSSITQAIKSVVDAYTSIINSNEFYDKAKAVLVDAYTGQTSTIVSRSAIEIDAKALNVNIDANAVAAFDITGNTVTIKASTFTGDITTTGVIILLNGAIFNGTRTDANGTIVPPLVLTVTSNISLVGAEVRLYDADSTGVNKGTELTGVETSAAATFVTSLITNANLIFIQIIQTGVEEEEISFTMGATSQTININRSVEVNE
jgi:hypothetical protein